MDSMIAADSNAQERTPLPATYMAGQLMYVGGTNTFLPRAILWMACFEQRVSSSGLGPTRLC